MRARLLDLTVATVCVACICAPLLQMGFAAAPQSSVVESGGNVDEKVLQSGIISNPLNGSFERGRSGKVDGAVQWDVYSTSAVGLKLLVSSDRRPAMRDAKHGVDIADAGSTLAAWGDEAGDRRFGFAIVGNLALDRFDNGAKWRGFNGTRPIEVGRRVATIPMTRTTVKLRAELGDGLADDAQPTANIDATAVTNL